MFKFMFKFSFILIFLVILNKHFFLCEDIILVKTKSGPINGFKQFFDGKEVNVFLGIPYAEPPLGELRFSKPKPVEEWTQPLTANLWPNNCYQIKNPLIDYKTNIFSEDCLYLNIWSPNTKPKEESRRPVLFFIHGGQFSMDTSSNAKYDGKALSALGDVIVVTINYRLGAFGFLYADMDDVPGNVGLWDQLMALQWVNQNIEYFGGNPQNITLMGFGSGSTSVSLHLLSPQSQYLFQNAIMMSGSAYSKVIERTAEFMYKKWLKSSLKLGCPQDLEYSYVKFTPDIIECLRNASADDILQMTDIKELSEPVLVWDRLVFVDMIFLPELPLNVMTDYYIKTNKNIFIGTAENEGSIFLNYFFDDKKMDKAFNKEEALRVLATLSNEFKSNTRTFEEEIGDHYFYAMNSSAHHLEMWSRIGRAVGDFYLSCPTIRFAEMLYFENSDYIKVYQYLSNYSIPNPTHPWTNKSHHGTDVWMIFGGPLQNEESREEHRIISRKMIEMFSYFARFGHPKSENGIEFKPFYTITDRIVKTYYEFSENPNPIHNYGIGLKHIECEYLWNPFLDNFEEMHE